MKGGDNVMSVSPKLRELAQEAARGLTDAYVMELTGLKHSTLRKIERGEVTGIDKIIRFAQGLQRDPAPFVSAAAEVTGQHNPLDVIGYLLTKELQLSPRDCLAVTNQIRELIERQSDEHGDNQQSAA